MTNQQISFDNIVQVLVQEAPTLQPLLDEHMKDQYGQIFQHVFFGDLTRYVMDRLHERKVDRGQNKPDDLVRILSFLEQGLLSPDEKVRELILASFVENLDAPYRADENLRAMLGPNLRRAIQAYGK